MSEELKISYEVEDSTPQIHCSLFEDNSGVIELARTKKYRPRTKYIAIKYHHFRRYIQDGLVSIPYAHQTSFRCTLHISQKSRYMVGKNISSSGNVTI